MRIPPDAQITSFTRSDTKTVIGWRDHAGKAHRATKTHTPGQLEIVSPEDELWPVIVRRVTIISETESEGRFEIGKLANMIAPMAELPHAHTGVKANLERLARDTGLAFETLDQYRKVFWVWSQHWREGSRIPSDAASWSAHQVLMGQPDAPEALAKLVADGGGRATKAAAVKLVQDRHDAGCEGCEQCASRRGITKARKQGSSAPKQVSGLQETFKQLGKVTISIEHAMTSLQGYLQGRQITDADRDLIIAGIESVIDKAGEIRQLAEGAG